jgi:hypothetical protein
MQNVKRKIQLGVKCPYRIGNICPIWLPSHLFSSQAVIPQKRVGVANGLKKQRHPSLQMSKVMSVPVYLTALLNGLFDTKTGQSCIRPCP